MTQSKVPRLELHLPGRDTYAGALPIGSQRSDFRPAPPSPTLAPTPRAPCLAIRDVSAAPVVQ
jgi:hypothetical protein